MGRVIVAAVLVLASLTLSWGDTPPAKPNIEQLIEQLNDKDFQARKAAEEAIEKIGPEALPALRKALAAKPSLEVSRRIEKWIPQFELAALSAPKRITLDVKDKPLQEVIELIARQSGHTVDLLPSEEREKKPYSFKLAGVTFWEAVEAVCAAGEMVPSRTGDGKGVQLQFSDNHQPFVSRHGAFRVVPQGFHYSYSRQRNNQLNMLPRQPAGKDKPNQQHEHEALQFSFMVEVEPSIPVLSVGQAVVTDATDDKMQNLVPDANNNVFMMRGRGVTARAGNFRGMFLHGYVQLKPAAKDATKIAVLKGTIPVHLEKEKKTVVLSEKLLEAKGKKFKVGDKNVEIDEVKDAGNQRYDLYLTLTGGKDGDDEPEGEIELLDQKGTPCNINGTSSSSDGQTTKLHLSFSTPNAGDIKLAYTTRVTLDYVLPFEFRDLPLP